MEPKTTINNGEAVLGIEFGSTRIKAVLADAKGATLAGGALTIGRTGWKTACGRTPWRTSSAGLQGCYASLKKQREWKSTALPCIASRALGISAP